MSNPNVREGVTINVRMEVERLQAVTDDVFQVWGYVGDYEVCLWLPRRDPRVRKLLGEANKA